MKENFLNFLICPYCRGALISGAEGFRCAACARDYYLRNGVIFFRKEGSVENEGSGDRLIFALKNFVKRSPKLFHFLNNILGVYLMSARKVIGRLPKNCLIINLGSGSEILREDVINVDYEPYPGVKIVGDAQYLPLADSSVDALAAESLLEHVRDPKLVIEEIYRVLKPGGLVYLTVPFIIGFHSSPEDYWRWTSQGLHHFLAEKFHEENIGIAVGPTAAFTYILREWLATLLSFNSNFVHQILVLIFMVLFAPLNLLDYFLANYKSAKNIAHIFYFIGVKRQ